MRTVSSAWPSTLLILWEPVWSRSSRLSRIAGAAGVLGEPARVGDRAGPAGVVALQPVELGEELRVVAGLVVLGGDLVDGGDQGLGHEPPAEAAEMPGGVGVVAVLGQAGARGRESVGLVVMLGPSSCRRTAGGAAGQRLGFGHAGCEPAVTSWRTAARGSSAVVPSTRRRAPRRPRGRRRSSGHRGPRTPDSATRSTSPGSPGASRPKIVRSTSRVSRFRALIPTAWRRRAAPCPPPPRRGPRRGRSCRGTARGRPAASSAFCSSTGTSAAPGRRRGRGPRAPGRSRR